MTTSESTKTQATGTFEIDSWNEEPLFHDDAGAKLGRTRLTKTFAGDLVGTSVVEMTAVSVPVDGADPFQGAAYVALERIEGSLQGNSGSFVVAHIASEPHGMKVAVIPGSGTGELSGITGELAIARHEDGSHTYTLDYQMG